jgi:hypothetical protein
VMMWGLTAGLAAGVLGGTAAALLHLPSRLLLAWIEAVALAAATRPLGLLRAPHVAALLAAVALALLATHLQRRSTRAHLAAPDGPDAQMQPRTGPPAALRWTAAVLAVGVLTTAMADVRPPPAPSAGPTPVGPGAQLWQADGAAIAIIDGRSTADGLLSALRTAGVARLDVLVVRTSADRAIGVATQARDRWPNLLLLVPRGIDGIAGALTPPTGSVMDVGPLRLRFRTTTDRLEPTIGERSPRRR